MPLYYSSEFCILSTLCCRLVAQFMELLIEVCRISLIIQHREHQVWYKYQSRQYHASKICNAKIDNKFVEWQSIYLNTRACIIFEKFTNQEMRLTEHRLNELSEIFRFKCRNSNLVYYWQIFPTTFLDSALYHVILTQK